MSPTEVELRRTGGLAGLALVARARVADLDLPSTVVGRIEQLAAESPGPDVDPARSAGADDFRSVLIIESAGRRRELRWTGAVAPPDVADIVAALLPLARPAT